MTTFDPRLLQGLIQGDTAALGRLISDARRRGVLPEFLDTFIAHHRDSSLRETLYDYLLSPPRHDELTPCIEKLSNTWDLSLPDGEQRAVTLLALSPSQALFDSVYERIMPIPFDEHRQLLERTQFRDWESIASEGLPVLFAGAAVMRGILGKGPVVPDREQEQFRTFAAQGGAEHWRDFLAFFGQHYALTPWIVAELADAMLSELPRNDRYLTRLLPTMDSLLSASLGDSLMAPLVHRLVLRKPTLNTVLERLVNFISKRDLPQRAMTLFIERLQSDSKPTREHAREQLAQLGAEAVARALPLLESHGLETRLEVARLVESHPHRNALPDLRKQAKKEQSKRIKAVLDRAITACELLPPPLDEAMDDNALDALLASRSRAKLPEYLELSAWPDLRYTSGQPMSEAARKWFIGQLFQEGPDAGMGLIELRTRLDAKDRANLLTVVQNAYPKDAPRERHAELLKPFFYMHAVLASEDQLRAFHERYVYEERRHAWAVHALKTLARAATPAAITAIDQTRSRARRSVSDHAKRILEDLAKRLQAPSIDVLCEAHLDTLGLAGRGLELRIDAATTWRITLDLDARLGFQTADGKIHKRMPKLPRSLKPSEAQRIRSFLAQLRRDLKRLLPFQLKRLERHVETRAPWSRAMWKAIFLDHPITATFRAHLLFSCVPASQSAGENELAVAWNTADEQFTSLDGTPVPLEDVAALTLTHPIDLTEEQRVQWLERLAPQPFPQLERDTYTYTPELHRALLSKLQEGWFQDLRGESLVLDGDHVQRAIGDITFRVAYYHEGEDERILRITSKSGAQLAPAELPPHVYSEMTRILLSSLGTTL